VLALARDPGDVELQVPSDQLKEAVAEFRKLLEPLGITCFGGLPESRILSTTSLGAIANALGTQLLAGRELLLEDNFTDVSALQFNACL
jgi:hypothetical protein